jgi:hypothetical protein
MNIIHKITIISMLFFGVFSNIYAQKNNGIAYVDLGLPSGNLWATNNIGGKGDYAGYEFAWGDTKSRSYYVWYKNSEYHYKYGNPSMKITKYCSNPAFGYQGYSDNLTVLQPEDDAATANWGEEWRIPTYEDWMELISNCTIRLVYEEELKPNSYTTYINGGRPMIWKVIGKNGNSISLPFSEHGYWSSSLNPKVPHSAWCFALGYNGSGMYYYLRSCGRHIRPVRSGKPSTSNNQPSNITNSTPSQQSISTSQPPKVYSNAYDGFVNIRQEPESKAPIIGVLRNGPEGAVLLGTEGEWKKIDCNGIVGYVFEKYVQDTPTEVFREVTSDE